MLNGTNDIVTHKSQCYHHTAQIVIYHSCTYVIVCLLYCFMLFVQCGYL